MIAKALIVLVRFYRGAISPWTPAACRYTPSCSAYALEAIERFGAARGTWIAMRRVGRCHPWGGEGYDPIPAAPSPSGDAPPAERLSTPSGPRNKRMTTG